MARNYRVGDMLPLKLFGNWTEPDKLFTDVPGPGLFQVLCPICRCEFVHCKEYAKDETDDYKAWQGRGSVDKLQFWCEDGHQWWLCFGFHKGQTWTWLQYAGEADQYTRPFQEGYGEQQKGEIDRSKNPYDEDEDAENHRLWNQGWDTAKKDEDDRALGEGSRLPP